VTISSCNYENNMALATDFYELTMASAYFHSGMKDTIGQFEMYVRKLPNNRNYLVVCGLEQIVSFLMNFKFTRTQIDFLKTYNSFKNDKNFLDYLANLKFTGDLWAVPEGTILFPNEPFLRIEAPIIQAQLFETYVLSMMNFQTLIASKASRIVNSAGDKTVIEFGFRRAHSPYAALFASRASYIAGCKSTSNTLASFRYGIPAAGTMAHSYIMSFEEEIEAFKKFVTIFPDSFLLIDTYDSINAIKKIIKDRVKCGGIRIDSGDLFYLCRKIRKILDKSGYKGTKIMVSGDLNEYTIKKLVKKKIPIDSFGVGTELVTSRDDPALNGVYKLVAIKKYSDQDKQKYEIIYKMKKSLDKISFPGPKQIFRIIKNDKFYKDILALEYEKIAYGIPLLKQFIKNGNIMINLPTILEIKKYYEYQMSILPRKFKRLDPELKTFPVYLSKELKNSIESFN
jgi:nicotinate phosphoribosyltransferase